MNENFYVSEGVDIAKELAIKEIYDCRKGQIINAENALPHDQEALHLRRREIQSAIQDGAPLYLCAYCSKSVYVALANSIRRSGLHFRHYKNDGDCIARTRSGWTQQRIEAQKYDGLKEGSLHRETKELLVASLQVDPNFSSIETETRWTNKYGTRWRQPDVRAVFRGQRVAFEIQLATTFLSVIESRSRFYLDEGARLIWVFRSFGIEGRPAAIDDIYFGNNRNAFVVSPATYEASIAANRAMVLCHWPQPELRGQEIVEIWKEQLIELSDTRTDETGREWFYDCDSERKKLRVHLLKQRIRSYCIDHGCSQEEERERSWHELVDYASTLKFDLRDKPEPRFRKLMSALFSLEEGIPIGFGLPYLISVAHHIYDKHKPLLYYFLHAENAYNRREQLLRGGKPGVWEQRRNEARQEMTKRNGPYSPDKTYNALVHALFPAVGAAILKRRSDGDVRISTGGSGSKA